MDPLDKLSSSQHNHRQHYNSLLFNRAKQKVKVKRFMRHLDKMKQEHNQLAIILLFHLCHNLLITPFNLHFYFLLRIQLVVKKIALNGHPLNHKYLNNSCNHRLII